MNSLKFGIFFSLVVLGRCEFGGDNGISSEYGAPTGGGYGGGNFGSSGGYGHYNGGGSNHGSHHEDNYDHHESKPYQFGYAVKDHHTGTDFGQEEQSDGQNVRGQYRVVLPDGRTQIVTYTADWKTGFHADVKYEGEARYPPPKAGYGHGGYGGGNDFSGHGGFNGGYSGGDAGSNNGYSTIGDYDSSNNYNHGGY